MHASLLREKNCQKMFVINLIIILSVLATAKADSKLENSNKKVEKSINTVYAADFKKEDVTLKTITSQQALPLVLIENDIKNTVVRLPIRLTKAEINKDGRLAYGTEFDAIPLPSKKALYFCPVSASEGNPSCLMSTNFSKSQALQCEIEPMPMIKRKTNLTNCGPDGIGIPLEFYYQICTPQQPYTYLPTNIIIYSFCYSQSLNRTLFVSYKTVTANMLTENLLAKEREIQFDWSSINTNILSKLDEEYNKIRDAAAKSNPKYEFQKMVRPEHYTLVTWRKPAYHFINHALQHQQFVSLWNEINDYIKANIIEMNFSPRIIRTGVIDIPSDQIPLSTDDENGQLYNIWYTAVADLNQVPYKGVVIMINNFITKNKKLRKYIQQICGEKNFCVKDLKKKFKEVDGRVQCCKITGKVFRFFHFTNNVTFIDEVLMIRNITYTYSNGKMITDD